MSQPSISRFIFTAGALVAVAATGYALYFDYQRRHDIEFRRDLKRKAKAQRAKETAATEEAKQAKLAQVGDYLTMELMREPLPQDTAEKQNYFRASVEEGEELNRVPGKELEAALKFYKALAVYPNPAELLGIYQRSISEAVYEYLVLMIAILPPTNVSSFLSGNTGVASNAAAAAQAEMVGIDE